MDTLKRHWFWVLSGFLALACAGAYAAGIFLYKAEAATQLEALQTEMLPKLDAWKAQWTADPAKIPGKNQAEAYQAFAEALKKDLDASKDLLKPPQRWASGRSDRWTIEGIKELDPTSFKGAYEDLRTELFSEAPDRPSKLRACGFSMKPSSLIFRSTDLPSQPEAIQLEGKRILVMLELIRILNLPEIKALNLPASAIRFADAGDTSRGATGVAGPAEGVAAAAPRLSPRAPLKDDPVRTTHPFVMTVDMDLQYLPALLDRLGASSFNLTLTGLQISRVPVADLARIVDEDRLCPATRRNEIVRLTLAGEAVEYLFLEKAPEKRR